MSAARDERPTLLFFGLDEAATVDALAGRIVPAGPDGPGAREAGAMVYVDHALSGFARDLQAVYQGGLRALDAFAIARFGAAFRHLSESDQDAVLTIIDSEEGPEGLRHFFAVVREHVMQGLFCDPEYGGNRDGIGWRMVGFPGAQWEYTAEQMARDFDATTIDLVQLADLYQRSEAVAR